MDSTPRLHLPYIAPQQAQKQVTYNAAMRELDLLVQTSVKSRSSASPPSEPVEGEAWLVPAGADGAWSGHVDEIAQFLDGGWAFRTAGSGFLLHVEDSGDLLVRAAGGWAALASTGSGLPRLGINATADLSNRLTVAADASLFSHAGGDHRLKLNKAGAGNTASMLFQSDWSGRAEFGLAGDDDFRVKVSPDGSSWVEALVVAADSGVVRLPQGQLGFPASANLSADPRILDDYHEGSWTPSLSFGGDGGGMGYAAANGGRFTRIGRLCVASGRLALSAKGGGSGAAVLGGLPFPGQPGSIAAVAALGASSGFADVGGTLVAEMIPASSTLALLERVGATTSPLTEAQFTHTTEVGFTLSYEVD